MNVFDLYMYCRIALVLSALSRYLDPDPLDLSTDLSDSMHPKYKSLNHAIASLVSAVSQCFDTSA